MAFLLQSIFKLEMILSSVRTMNLKKSPGQRKQQPTTCVKNQPAVWNPNPSWVAETDAHRKLRRLEVN